MADPAHEYPTEHVDVTHVRAVPASTTGTGVGWAMLGVRVLLTLIGAGGMVVSAFMRWANGRTAINISVRSLWSTHFEARGSTFVDTIGFAMVVVGLVAIIGLAPTSGWLTRLAGALGIAAFVLFVIEIYRADLTITTLQEGPWVALGGAVVALIGGFFGTRTVAAAPGPTYVEPA